MRRGTTPTLSFELPIETEVIQELYITFSQGSTVVLEKTKHDVELEDNIIYLHMSQADTLALSSKQVELQLRIKTNDDEALASDIITTSAERILKDGQI